jgi:hypothetical protein
MNIDIQMTHFKGTLYEMENSGRTFDYTFHEPSLQFTKCILVSTLGDFPIEEGDYICNIGGGDFVLKPNIAKEFLKAKLMDESASICRNPTSVEDKIAENMEKLYPEDGHTTGHPERSISTVENLWDVYNTFRSHAMIQGGTVEFNKEGEIENLIVNFKTNNNG